MICRAAPWLVVAAQLLSGVRASAIERPAHPQLKDFDKRLEPRPQVALSPEQERALEKLRAQVPKARVELDELVGGPKYVWAGDGFLSGPRGEGRAIPTSRAKAFPLDDPYRPLKAFLSEHAPLYRYGPEALNQARKVRDFATPHNGLRTVAWQQQLGGIPVYEAVLVGHITPAGELVNVASRFVAQPAEAAAEEAPRVKQAGKRFGIEAIEAVHIACQQIEEPVELAEIIPLSRPEGATLKQVFRAGELPDVARAELVWVPIRADKLRLCWQVELTRRLGGERYRVLVQCRDGEVLLRRCLTVYLSPVTFHVWTSDSPSPFTPGYPEPTTNQPPVIEREWVTLTALNTNASPLGWVNDGLNETRGNNVDAHLDRDANNIPDLPRPQGSPHRVFDFPVDLNGPPAEYGAAAVAQLFYWCNWMHDRLYELGFTEAAGNFQKDNLGRGGRGHDPILADAQDGSGQNNANYTPAPDGEPARIQMFVFSGPEPDRDGDLDAEIVLHEYTHGLSDRLVGGGSGISALQTVGMAEGWSDFYALALLSEPGDDPDGVYPVGAYASHEFLGLKQNYYFGIRRYPYCTDMNKNPLTFKDIDPFQASPHLGVPRNPIFAFNPVAASEVHNQGEVWCMMLWEARANLIHKYGFEEGNELILRLVTDGMKLSPPNPTFIEARDAIIQADLVNNGGANWSELWAAFAKRGMGFSARAPFSSTTVGVVEAYDLPDALLVTPLEPFIASGPPSGPLTPTCRTYTLTNHSEAPLQWRLAVGGDWLEASPREGILPPRTGTNVEVCLTPRAYTLPVGVHPGGLAFTNVTSGFVHEREANLRLMNFAPMPVVQDFESGVLNSFWQVSGRGDHRVRVTDNNEPHEGEWHLTMDSSSGEGFGRNELTLGVDLAGYTNVMLRFWARQFGDEPDGPPPVPFVDGADFDGVAISADGVHWYEVVGLRRLGPDYTEFTVDLDEALRRFGLEYNSTFRIRFNQFDDFQIPFDGIALDDITLEGVPAWRLQLHLPAEVDEGAGLLAEAARIEVAVPPAADLPVQLESSRPDKLSVPPGVILPAGATQAVFALNVLDDGLLDGTQPVEISASAPGYFGQSAGLRVRDNEHARLYLRVLEVLREGVGVLTNAGWVMASRRVDADAWVTLESGDTNEIRLPPRVQIPAGQQAARFNVEVVDDRRLDGTQRVTLRAHVENWVDGLAEVEVLDNDVPGLRLFLPTVLSEGNGRLTNAGVLRVSGQVRQSLEVTLQSDAPDVLAVPERITVPEGENFATFDLEVVDNSEADGRRTVQISAAAPGFGSDTASVDVLDDETPPAAFGPRPPDQAVNVSPATDLSWHAGFGEALINGGFETGDFTGWEQEADEFGSFVINDGQLDPEGPDEPLPPFEGRFSAVSQQFGSGRRVLYQELTIPSDATVAQLSWADQIRNHASHFAPDEQEYRVEIRTGANPLALAYSTQPGDPLTNDWQVHTFDLSPFRGMDVRIAFIEEDRLGYFNVHVDQVSVNLGDPQGAVFDVYLGTNATLSEADWVATTTEPKLELPTLELNTTYYWQVATRRAGVTNRSPVWQFTTRGIGELDHFAFDPIAPTQSVFRPFPVRITARDDAEHVVSDFNGAVVLEGIPLPERRSSVLITEVDTGLNDRVEFANVSEQPVDVSGWRVVLYDGKSWPAPKATFEIPTNTLAWPATLFQLKIVGHPPGGYPNFVAGTNVTWGTRTPLSNQVAVLLQDAAGEVKDFFCAVNADPSLIRDPMPLDQTVWSGNPLPFTNDQAVTYQRIGDVDHNTAADWVLAPGTVGSRNAQIHPLFAPPQTVPLGPTNVVVFTNGVWAGELTVHRLQTNMLLRAREPSRRRGDSDPFAVVSSNDLAVTMTDLPDLLLVGDLLTYYVTVFNNGDQEATDVRVIDVLPSEVEFFDTVVSQGIYEQEDGVIVWEIGRLGPGKTASARFVATARAPGVITNQVTLRHAEAETYLDNNQAFEVSTINQAAVFTTVTIASEPQPGGTTNAVFPVQLLAPSRLPVSVEYATSNRTATANEDYVPQHDVLVFAPGEVKKQVEVPIIADGLDEPGEVLELHLLSATNATILLDLGLALIRDLDPRPTLHVEPAAVAEPPPHGVTNMVFHLSVEGRSALPLAVNYATINNSATAYRDFEPQAGVLTFPAGRTNLELAVRVLGDSTFESNETFTLIFSNAVNLTLDDTEVTGTILDNGEVDLDHFTWEPIPSPQLVHTPFPVEITARDGRGELFPDFEGTVALQAVASSQEAVIGDGTNVWELPLGTYFHDNRVQTIYTADELPGAGELTALSLDVTQPPPQVLSNWTIRLKTTALDRFYVPAWETDGWTTVYFSAEERVLDSGWVTFRFPTPFPYNGTDNLLVDFSFDNADYTSDGFCRVTELEHTRTLFFQTDSAFGSPTAWSSVNAPPPELSRLRPNLRVRVESTLPITPSRTGPFVQGVWRGTVSLTQPFGELFLRAVDALGHSGESEPFAVATTTDRDGDGLPDPWEERFFGAIDAPEARPDADPDGDGLTNAQEYQAGTNPRDATSVVRVDVMRLPGGVLRLRFDSVAGKTYRLEQTDHLGPDAIWSVVPGASALPGNGSAVEWDYTPEPDAAQRFFRVRLSP